MPVELPKQACSFLTRGAILLVPLVLILPQFLEMTGIWFSFPLCELLTAGMLTLLPAAAELHNGFVRYLPKSQQFVILTKFRIFTSASLIFEKDVLYYCLGG